MRHPITAAAGRRRDEGAVRHFATRATILARRQRRRRCAGSSCRLAAASGVLFIGRDGPALLSPSVDQQRCLLRCCMPSQQVVAGTAFLVLPTVDAAAPASSSSSSSLVVPLRRRWRLHPRTIKKIVACYFSSPPACCWEPESFPSPPPANPPLACAAAAAAALLPHHHRAAAHHRTRLGTLLAPAAALSARGGSLEQRFLSPSLPSSQEPELLPRRRRRDGERQHVELQVLLEDPPRRLLPLHAPAGSSSAKAGERVGVGGVVSSHVRRRGGQERWGDAG